jgi:hypothetical protein
MEHILAFWDYAVRAVFKHAEAAESAGLAQGPLEFQLLLHGWLWITDSPDAKGIEWTTKSGKLQQADLERALRFRQGLHPWLVTVLNDDLYVARLRYCNSEEALAAAYAGLNDFILNVMRGGIDINSTVSAGQIALHEAAAMGECTTIRLIVSLEHASSRQTMNKRRRCSTRHE